MTYDAQEALEKLTHARFGLILPDLHLPEYDQAPCGLALPVQSRKISPDSPLFDLREAGIPVRRGAAPRRPAAGVLRPPGSGGPDIELLSDTPFPV